ncbi:hypothetical protein [Xanthomonas phage JGB6]|nr:hypothetical protein [Xanthomonas phage JGB6]
MGYSHVALADTMSLSALISVAKAAKKVDLQVITGVQLRVRNPYNEKGYYNPRVYVRNEAGLQVLYKLLSEAEKDRDWRFVSHEKFIESLSEDVVVTSGSQMGILSHVFDDAQRRDVIAQITKQTGHMGFVVDLSAVPVPVYARQNIDGVIYADGEHLHAINPMALYKNPLDHDARDVMQGLLARRKIHMGTMRWFPDKGRFIKEPEEVVKDLAESLSLGDKLNYGLGEIDVAELELIQADEFKYRWEKAPPAMPLMAADEFEELKAQCKARFSNRIMRPVFGYQPDASLLPEYVARLKFELDILGVWASRVTSCWLRTWCSGRKITASS